MRFRSFSAGRQILSALCVPGLLVAALWAETVTAVAAIPVEVPAQIQSAGVPPESAEAEAHSDWLPPDPAEWRPQLLPPPRPDDRAVTVGGTWVSRGPAPTFSAQLIMPPDNEVSGAVQAIATHPVNPDIVYLGAVNGGVWKSINATAAQPAWTPLTDNLPSLSIGALGFDPLDASHQTLIAGTARVSSLAQRGDDEVGVYYTSNGGANWNGFGAATLLGQKLIAVSARGTVLMAASANGGLYRSSNGGGVFSLISGTGNLPTGGIFDLVGDRANNSRFYVAVKGAAPKVLRSDDGGASWTDVTSGLTALSASTANMKLAVGAAGVVYLATVNNTGVANKNALARVSRSANFGASWTAMDVPAIHLGLQGAVHASIAADSGNPNLVYLGGDRVNTYPYSGNLVRGDASLAAGSQFSLIYGAGGNNTQPHADSRAMAFDANGNLLEGDDGGIYRRSSPTSASGSWTSMVGNLAITEVHNVAHDRVANVIMIGTQDNGTHWQQTASNPRWLHVYDGDGGDVAIDDITLGATGSYRYDSFQNLGQQRVSQYNAANGYVANNFLWTIPDAQFITPIKLSLGDPKRMLIGGSSFVYESTNAIAAGAILTSLGGPGANEGAMVYGANGNTTVAYVGKGATVYVRQGNAFVATAGALPAGAFDLTDLAMDPDDTTRVYAIDNDQVFRTTNAGASWQDITGNLTTISAQDFRTIEFIPDALGDLLALGTRSGVYSVATSGTIWSLFGSSLPNVPVYDLRYLVAARTLIAGTFGRGVWTADYPSPNTAPSFTPAAAVSRQRGSSAGAAVALGTVSDAQTAAGSLSVTQIAGGTATAIAVGAIANNSGSISATLTADCSAGAGTLRFQASDGNLTGSGDLQVNLTANTPPTLTYANAAVTVGTGSTLNPSSGPSDNGSILTIIVQSAGTYTGGISVNPSTGVITLTNAGPVGVHSINLQAGDNCFSAVNAPFQLTVNATPNTAPTFTPAAAITRQQGSAAGAAVIVGSVTDAQTAPGSLSVTQIAGGSSTGVTVGAIANSAGSISTPVAASCSATAGTLRFQASDGSLTGSGNLQVNVSANTAPTLSYANAVVSQGAGSTINPLSGPSDNGSILTVIVQSPGTYTGGISVSNITGVITLTNAAPAGIHTLNIQTADNCFVLTNASVQLTVQAGSAIFASGFE